MKSHVLALAGVLGATIACRDGSRPTATATLADTADQVLIGMSHYVTVSGVQRARVRADTAYLTRPRTRRSCAASIAPSRVEGRVLHADVTGGDLQLAEQRYGSARQRHRRDDGRPHVADRAAPLQRSEKRSHLRRSIRL